MMNILTQCMKTKLLSTYLHPKICDGGVMVSIVAFQAIDPGSIPGHRRNSFFGDFGENILNIIDFYFL